MLFCPIVMILIVWSCSVPDREIRLFPNSSECSSWRKAIDRTEGECAFMCVGVCRVFVSREGGFGRGGRRRENGGPRMCVVFVCIWGRNTVCEDTVPAVLCTVSHYCTAALRFQVRVSLTGGEVMWLWVSQYVLLFSTSYRLHTFFKKRTIA